MEILQKTDKNCNKEILTAAREAYQEGLLPLPCAPGEKRPLGCWKDFQKRRPSWEELESRFLGGAWDGAAFGTLTGSVTRRAVVDVDPRNGGDPKVLQKLGLPPTRTAVTGSGGWHFHYSVPNGVKLQSRTLAPGVELKGESGFVLLPPSVHPQTGERYVWVEPNAPVVEFPLNKIGAGRRTVGGIGIGRDYVALWRGVPQGQRHIAATRLCGHLLRQGLPQEEVAAILELWNSTNRPPLPEGELGRVVADIADKEQRKQDGQRLELPDKCYVGILRDFCDLFDPYYEVPRCYWLFSLATIIGAALAGKITLTSDLRVEPRLYTVLLGRSGVEKKSTSIRRTLEFVEGTGHLPPVSYGVGSAEGLGEQLNESKNLLLVCDEFRSVMTKARIEGSVLGPMLCTLFESGNFENRTKGKNLRVRGARLSLLAACTAESYQLVWDPHSLAIGLNNRLLVAAGESSNVVPFVQKVPEKEERALQDRLRKLFEELEKRYKRRVVLELPDGGRYKVERGLPLELELAPKAQEVWAEWYTARPRDLYSVRLDTIGMRLLVIYAFAQGNFEGIDARTVEAVCALLDWEQKVRMVHDPVDAQGKIAKMEALIKRQLAARGPLTRRELKRFTNAHRAGEWVFRTALENLLAAGEVVYNKAAGCFELAGE